MKKSSKVLALLLAVLMIVSVIPMSALAAIDNYDKDFQSETHTVFRHTEQTLAPGVTNYTNYAYSADGKQMVYYVTTADLNRDDVIAQVAYKGMQNDEYGMDKLSNMVACANEKYSDPTNPQYISDYYTVVSACNGDGYNMTTGEPSGVFIMGGNIKKDWDIKSNPVFLAILNDGSAVIANTQAEWDACKEAGVKEAIDIFGSNLVWDGVDVTANSAGSYNTDRHSRTMVGITADGKLVICTLDGRQEPFSCGGSMHELAQIMLEAGCVRAFNLDGGGSATFIAKNEGSDDATVINRPSDGSERSISNGIIIASTAIPSNTFDHVTMSVADEYITAGTSTALTCVGVSPSGTSAVIPEGVTYVAANGTVANGVYTAEATGTDTITAYYNETVVGTVTVQVVIPDSIMFNNTTFTVPYGKTAELGITAIKGLNVVKTKVSDFTVTLENADAGVLNGFTITAPSEESAITGTKVTAVFNADSTKSTTSTIAFGKGSEVLEDFEGFTIPGSWNIITGYPQYGPDGANGQNEKGTIEMVNALTGKVHSGDGALAINVDMSQLYETGYHLLNFNFGFASFTIPANATAFGFWMYVPEEDTVALYSRCLIDTDGNTTGDYTPDYLPIGFASTYKEAGWHYYSMDMSKYSSQDAKFFCIQIYIMDRDGSNYNYYFKDQYSVDAKFTLYLDDITVDYSTVVDDREAPVFSSVKYADGVMSDAAELNNQTTHDSVISFTAEVAEDTAKNNYTGLNTSTAKAYIDGKEVNAVYSAGKIAIQDAVLADGVHTVSFEIADNMGNVAKISRKITVAANTGLTYVNLVPQTPAADKILIGSVQWFDLTTNAIENIDSITTVLNLNSVSNWELEGMSITDGFTVSYEIDAITNDATITITRTGVNTETGEAVMASIPVRTWVSTITNDKGYETSTPDSLWKRKIIWPKDVKISADYGVVILTDGTETTFSSERYQVITELYGNYAALNANGDYANKSSWHVHTVTAVDDKAATCTEAGYTGRTYCAVCNSVVDWGTTIPATGHAYEFVDGVLKCISCGDLFNGEWTDGKSYADGIVFANGWSGESYYIDGVKQCGLVCIDGLYHDFGEDGICEERVTIDGFYFDESIHAYRHFTAGNMDIGDVDVYPTVYFFDENGCAISGDVNILGYSCTFDEHGAFVSSADNSVIDAGYCGTNIMYVLFNNGTLKVDGEGVMKDYTANGGNFPAWIIKNDPTDVTKLVFGNGITEIGRFGFYRNQFLNSVEFEENSSLKVIKWAAFGHCWRLANITLPASVEEICDYAFYECGALKTVAFEDNSKLISIGTCAFMHNIGLKSVFIPDSVSKMAEGIFVKANTSVVLNVVADSLADIYAQENGISTVKREGIVNAIASGECNDGINWSLYANGDLVINGSGAMENYTSYEQQPWASYRHLIKKVVIGADITAVGNYAFAYTQNLADIEFEEGSKLNSIGVLSFMNAAKITEVILPDSVTSISAYGFGFCYDLTDVLIPQGVNYIYYTAFTGSDSVSLNVAEGTYAEDFAISNEIAYTVRDFVYAPIAGGICGENATWQLFENGELRINGSGAMENYTSHTQQPWASYRHLIKKVVIGADITAVGNYAFAYTQNLAIIKFEEGSKLNSIGILSFMNAAKITEVILPDSVTYIGAYGFGCCYDLAYILIPQRVNYIYFSAFMGSENISLNVAEGTYAEDFATSNEISYTVRDFVYLPIASGMCGENATWQLFENGELRINGSGAMENYTSHTQQPWASYRHLIKKVIIGADITTVGNYAFAYTQNLADIEFEEGSKVNSIGILSFMNAAKLTEVTLPDSVTSISAYGFGCCYDLTDVYISSNTNNIYHSAFTASSQAVIHTY